MHHAFLRPSIFTSVFTSVPSSFFPLPCDIQLVFVVLSK